MTTATQGVFNPVHYGFEWTEDGWYKLDEVKAHADAKRDRDAAAAELRKQGRKVKKWTAGRQLISMGGIGSGRPRCGNTAGGL